VHQVGFPLLDYTEMHGQQNIKFLTPVCLALRLGAAILLQGCW